MYLFDLSVTCERQKGTNCVVILTTGMSASRWRCCASSSLPPSYIVNVGSCGRHCAGSSTQTPFSLLRSLYSVFE